MSENRYRFLRMAVGMPDNTGSYEMPVTGFLTVSSSSNLSQGAANYGKISVCFWTHLTIISPVWTLQKSFESRFRSGIRLSDINPDGHVPLGCCGSCDAQKRVACP